VGLDLFRIVGFRKFSFQKTPFFQSARKFISFSAAIKGILPIFLHYFFRHICLPLKPPYSLHFKRYAPSNWAIWTSEQQTKNCYP
jgi:hypothetical protein